MKIFLKRYPEAAESDKDIYRDSAIQRFEYSVDTFWKYLKNLLETKYGLKTIGSPKAIFREAATLNLLSQEDLNKLIAMIDARNLTSHGYNQNLADEIFQEIPKHYDLLCNLSERLCKSN